MSRLNQVIAIESGVKTRVNAQVSDIYKSVQHGTLFDGFSKQYKPLAEGGQTLPPESKRVQKNAMGLVTEVSYALSELFDVTATKDFGNCSAQADITVDGVALLTGVPVTYLLFLEKQLTDIHTFVGKLPVLDPAEEWKFDANASTFRTDPRTTVRTAKVQEPIVLLAPTPEHPGQAQLITKDVIVGNWEETKMSGAVPAPKKAELVSRVEKLQKAVKFAREEANTASVPDRKVSEKIFGWLLS